MSVKPQSEMSFKPGRMSEEVEYLRNEVALAVRAIEASLGKKTDQAVIMQMIAMLEKVDKRLDSLEEYNHYQIKKSLKKSCSLEETVDSVITLSNQVEGLKNAMIALAQKLDSNSNVGETDHEQTVRDNL